MHTVLETPRFLADAARLFTDAERDAIIDLISADHSAALSFRAAKVFARFGWASGVAESAAEVASYIFLVAMMCRSFFWRHLPKTKRTIWPLLNSQRWQGP